MQYRATSGWLKRVWPSGTKIYIEMIITYCYTYGDVAINIAIAIDKSCYQASEEFVTTSTGI